MRTTCILALATVLTGCAEEPALINRVSDPAPFSSTEPLVGRWHSASGSVLTLSANGEFHMGKQDGCWKKEGATVIFKSPCANKDPQPNSAIMTLAEYLYPCTYALSDRLTLHGCFAAGEYRRE